MGEHLAAGWVKIRVYPIERRPIRVAANLLRDIEYEAFTRTSRRYMSRRESPASTDDVGAGGVTSGNAIDASAFDEVVEVLAAGQAAGVDPADLRFAAALAGGRSIDDLAAERGVSGRAERYRRTRVAAQLRDISHGWEPRTSA